MEGNKLSKIGNEIVQNFEENLKSVQKLANFDRLVLDFAIQSIDILQSRLKEKFENERLLATNTLTQLKKIRQNDSMRPQYQEIFNQCVVLLVSYFGSTVHDIFSSYVPAFLSMAKEQEILNEELRFSIKELKGLDFDLREHLGEIIISKRNISFQDMQSIRRSFRDFMNISIDKDSTVNNIILGQACRHVVVHAGGRVNSKLIRQVSKAIPRKLKLKIEQDKKVEFTTDEIDILSQSMRKFVAELVKKLKQSLVH